MGRFDKAANADPAVVADEMTKVAGRLAAGGIKEIVWLPLAYNPANRAGAEVRYGLLDPDGNERPAGAMLAGLAAAARGADRRADQPGRPDGVAFTGQAGTNMVLWSESAPVQVDLPAGRCSGRSPPPSRWARRRCWWSPISRSTKRWTRCAADSTRASVRRRPRLQPRWHETTVISDRRRRGHRAAGHAPPRPHSAAGRPTHRIVVADGVTQPVFGYADAIRERLFIDSTFDSDHDGLRDIIAFDVIRPRATENGLKVPVVMDASPYYSTVCRGNEAECKADLDGDGLLDKWPLFYDNYFVPRGYAVILLDMVGTNNSTGCPTTNANEDNLSAKQAVNWLNGRATARNAAGQTVVADWDNGRSGDDRQVLRRLAGPGHRGHRRQGPDHGGADQPAGRVLRLRAQQRRDHPRQQLRGRAWPTRSPTRNAGPTASRCATTWPPTTATRPATTPPSGTSAATSRRCPNQTASVLFYHGLNDDNVRPDHFSKYWYALAEQQHPAQAVAVPGGPRRPVRRAPRRCGCPRCTAGSTSGCTVCRTASWTSRWWTSSGPPTCGRPTPTGRCRPPWAPRCTSSPAATCRSVPGARARRPSRCWTAPPSRRTRWSPTRTWCSRTGSRTSPSR